jgi:hypothetical protein
MSPEQLLPAPYAVEISGWDSNKDFFVEMTDLEWSEEEKIIHVQHPIQQGALIFIRLVGISVREGVFPVAYEAAAVKFQPLLLTYEISLKQILPRQHPYATPKIQN